MAKIRKWASLRPRSSATVRRTETLTGPRKLPGPCTTTRSKQYLSAMHPCSEWGACLTAQTLQFWGQMTPEWKVFVNLCPKSALQPRFTCRGQIWRKSAFAKLPKSHLMLLTKKTPALSRAFRPNLAPKISWTLSDPVKTCACVPTLVQIGCGLPDLFRKESKK